MRPIRYGGRRVDLGARVLREERGIALLMAVGILFVLTLVLATVIFLTAASARDSQRTNAGQRAHALAEAGINNALAVLNANYPGTVPYPGNASLLPTRTTVYSSGSVDWSGSLGPAPSGLFWKAQWILKGKGSVPNPTGPGAPAVQRTVTAVVPVIVPTVVPAGDKNPLDFIYALNNLTFNNSVEVASPVWAGQDLTLQSSSVIRESALKAFVGRNLILTSPQNQIGHVLGTADPANDIGEVHVGNQCVSQANAALHPCNWTTDKIFAVVHDNIVDPTQLDYTPTMTCCNGLPGWTPTVSGTIAPAPAAGATSFMGYWYQFADLGPQAGCTTGSVPFSFDTGDNTINNSATPAGTSAINLTPTTSYSCKLLNSSGQTAAELSWNESAKKLTIKGNVYIDGSATINPDADATYTGQGSIFLSGTFAMKGAPTATICAVAGGSHSCNASLWNPNLASLIIVADGDGGFDSTQRQGGVVAPGVGIDLQKAAFQGVLLANKTVIVETSSEQQGPMLSVYHDVLAGQTGVLTFPPVFFLPSGGGGGGGPLPVPQLLPPQQFGGS